MLRFQGILLFLFIPIVLILYLAFPLGILPSVILGIVIMLGHKFVARPWMFRNLDKRDVWNGNILTGKTLKFEIKERKESYNFYSQDAKTRDEAIKFFNFAFKWRKVLAPAILGTVFWYLLSILAGEISSSLVYASPATLVSIFKFIIAVTVVLASILYKTGSTDVPVKGVFPAHNLFLLGISWTLWIFRIVGLWWIIAEIVNCFN